MNLRILLFDWTIGGHHLGYLRRIAISLVDGAEVTVAAPDVLLAGMADLPIIPMSLGGSRPAIDHRKALAPQHAALAEAELDLFRRVIADTQPGHALHVYADPILRWIIGRSRYPTRVSLLVFFVRWHYPIAYGIRMPLKERLRSWFQWTAIERWRRRADAHSLLMLDEQAARLHDRWSFGRAARTYWLPEPPVSRQMRGRRQRSGVAIFGSLAERKGIGMAAQALALIGNETRFVLAGGVEPQFQAELDRLIGFMREAGVDVELRSRPHSEEEGLGVLAGARVALLPYPRHYGMSRVLLEAASVGTPVITHDFGLIAYLVRKHGIGEIVDCTNATALAAAIRQYLTGAPDPSMADRLERFARLYSADNFIRSIRRPFGIKMETGTHRALTPGTAAMLRDPA